MTKLYFSVFILFITSTNTIAQYFAPLGAKWVYTHRHFSGPETDYNVLTVIDTSVIINGKICSKLSKLISACSPTYEYIYYENDVVFQWNPETEFFDTLFNFKLDKGQGWGQNVIDSVVYVDINGTTLKGLYLNGETFGGPVLERIGSPYSFFFEYSYPCDPVDGGWIRCYSDSMLGEINFTDMNCYYVYTSIKEKLNAGIDIYPNPAQSHISIQNLTNIKIKDARIFNTSGIICIAEINPNEKIQIGKLFEGIYFIQLQTTEGFIVKKIIIE